MTEKKKKKPTVQDVALKAGVSPATVSMILGGRLGVSFAEETVQKVRKAAESIGYKRPGAARAGIFDRPTIAIFITIVTGNYYTMIAQAITQEAHRAGYDTLILETHREAERELRLMHMVSRSGAAGIVFAVPPQNKDYVVTLAGQIPTVVVHNRRNDIALDTVATDDSRVGMLVAEHLLGLGHRHVAFIDMSHQWQGVTKNQRLEGAQEAFDRWGDARLCVFSSPAPNTLRPGSFLESRQMAKRIAEEVIRDKKITAFIGISDYVAYGIMDALSEGQYKVPQDYSVCGCDNLFTSNLPGVSLTTVERHPTETGVKSFDLLFEKMNEKHLSGHSPAKVIHVEYVSRLIVRSSTAPPRKQES